MSDENELPILARKAHRHNKTLNSLSISGNRKKSKRSFSLNIKPSNEVMISLIPNNFALQNILDLFEDCDIIRSCRFSIDSNDPTHKRCFVQFQTVSQARDAITKINTAQGDCPLFAEFVKSEENEGRSSQTILVEMIPKAINYEQLRQQFTRFGDILSAEIVENDEDNESWGCMITYSRIEESYAAYHEMHETQIEPGLPPIIISFRETNQVISPSSPITSRIGLSRMKNASSVFCLE